MFTKWSTYAKFNEDLVVGCYFQWVSVYYFGEEKVADIRGFAWLKELRGPWHDVNEQLDESGSNRLLKKGKSGDVGGLNWDDCVRWIDFSLKLMLNR